MPFKWLGMSCNQKSDYCSYEISSELVLNLSQEWHSGIFFGIYGLEFMQRFSDVYILLTVARHSYGMLGIRQ